MDCFVCCESFNLSDRLPILICNEGHTACSRCSEVLNKCPLCRISCPIEKKVNFALQDLVKAARDGDLCPQIPSDQIVLKNKIAEGGFAVIYAAEWSGLPVAVKMVSLTEPGRIRLQRELNLLINLNHPSILRVFGISFFSDTIGIVMEKASSSLPLPKLSHVINSEICQRVSVIHGDLKPANILLVDDHVRVADFGTSKNLAATTTVTRDFAISYSYAAPEQFQKVLSPLCDIYSLGVCLYELFENKMAFGEEDLFSIVDAKRGGKPLPFRRSTHVDLKTIILKCLNPDPAFRPTISEVSTVLNNIHVLDDIISNFDHSFLIVENESLRKENSKLLLQNQNISITKKRFQETVDSLNRKISNLETENRHLKEDFNASFKEKERYYHQTISDLQAKNSSLKQLFCQLETNNSDVFVKISGLVSEINALKSQHSETVKDFSRLQTTKSKDVPVADSDCGDYGSLWNSPVRSIPRPEESFRIVAPTDPSTVFAPLLVQPRVQPLLHTQIQPPVQHQIHPMHSQMQPPIRVQVQSPPSQSKVIEAYSKPRDAMQSVDVSNILDNFRPGVTKLIQVISSLSDRPLPKPKLSRIDLVVVKVVDLLCELNARNIRTDFAERFNSCVDKLAQGNFAAASSTMNTLHPSLKTPVNCVISTMKQL
ncbi:hypothetical protein GEMRC1_003180 [Eukaryota sp. GEM-RC1]